ncbi:acyl-CoA thioesterase [Chitinophaga deserti]|uniref:acyl-CoA thioesterase n=1 Tax=Chitinophaga deserti TaxID=2164099 RepID=UPI000D6DAAB0|nr:acyl-CoA thioesterase [Chitinophaga deserti]
MIKEPGSLYTIRFNDCDPFGHLNNAAYLNYFMNAREDHLAEHYDLRLKDFAMKGRGWVVTEHRIAYLKPALVAEKVYIFTRVTDFSHQHISVEMWMTDEQQQKVKSFLMTRFAHVDLKTGKRADHDEELVQLLQNIRVDHNPDETFEQRLAARLQAPSIQL